MYDQAKITAISLKPEKWNKGANADKMEALFGEAARQEPQLILTTEGVLEGYGIMDVIEGRRTAQELLEIAEPIDGPYIQRFQRLAKRLGTCLCFGFAERIGDEAYNCAVVLDREGDICGKYHKVQLAEGAHPSWNYNRTGKTIRAFETPVGRIGIMICNDRWNPVIARTLVLDGARAILIPSWGDKSKANTKTVLARARENGVPIVLANVGVNLFISKGEIVAYAWGNDRITTAVIDLPHVPSTEAARRLEAEFYRWQGPEMEKRYQDTMTRIAEQGDASFGPTPHSWTTSQYYAIKETD
jgi:predicted amidohydrolase